MLITIVVIGIVAVLTIPAFYNSYQEKLWASSSSGFQKKLGEAMQNMETQGALTSYDTTEEFIQGLQKYIKIMKVCDNTHLSDCFSKSIKDESGTKVDTTTAYKTSSGFGRAVYNTNTLGVVFVDGISALIAYNPKAAMAGSGAVKLDSSADRKSVTLSTSVISMMYDVTGTNSPNIIGQDIYTKNVDIKGSSGECTTVDNGMCVKNLGTNYVAISCADEANADYCGSYLKYIGDRWAGANKACKDLGLELPTADELAKLVSIRVNGDSTGAIPSSGRYWTDKEHLSYPTYYSYYLDMGSGMYGSYFRDSNYGALCIKR